MSGQVLVTGADGYLGAAIARRLLHTSDHRLLLWCRAADTDEASRKRARLSAEYAPHGDRVELAFGDLRQPQPFDELDPATITHIVHGAAVVRFNVERELAHAVNVEGSRRLLAFARRCERLERVGLLGSLYAAGLIEGDVVEAPLPAAKGFSNYYEWSKRTGEDLLHAEFADLPVSVFRIATLIADDDEGHVSHFNAIHNSLRLVFYGLLTLLPGAEHTRVYVATRDLAARCAAQLLLQPGATGIFHVGPDAAQALPLGQLRDIVYESFQSDAGFRSARILKPLLSDLAAFEALAEGVGRFAGPVLHDVVQSVAPFAPQLFSDKRFSNARLLQFMGPWSDPDGASLTRRTCIQLVRNRWRPA